MDANKVKVRKTSSYVIKGLVLLSAVLTISVLVLIVGYIFIKGIPYLSKDLFKWEYTSENVSMMPAIVNTFIMIVVSLAIAVPIGVFSAIYLTEYAKKGNKFVEVIQIMTETLAGIPSIIYGLFGQLFFVIALSWGISLMAGSVTLGIMILPVIIRTSQEALIAVPDSFREGSFGLGAGKLRTVFKIVLPNALPGILSGIILSIGRIVGETAALIYTSGTVAQIPSSVFGSGRTLALHMYSLSGEGFHTNQAYATAVVLLGFVLIMNQLSSFIARKFIKR